MVSYIELALEYLPALNRVQNFKPKSIKETVDFAFDPKNRIIAPAQIREEASKFLTLMGSRGRESLTPSG